MINKTRITKDFFKSFNKRNINKIKVYVIIMFVAMTILSISLYSDNKLLAIIIFSVAIIISIFFMFFYEKILLNQIVKNNDLIKNNAFYEYEFLKDNFTIKLVENNTNIGSITIDYEEVYKISESNNYLYIFVSKAVFYALNMDEMVNGQSSDLKKLLNKKVKKYKIRN
ncbi:YcxB family protein [Haploplasma axanthum]|uniref:YcxB-like C-terminal domain-containing protein n=1 Tax=Haploplasma axanthum TaxID=29552 RepID=A0A449BDW6_HAPAX|nr:YcxB family protein [Haploplasma axanthum]VEU80617.1 Uncharacterised protein [Haploplasma axanthum]